MLTDSMGATLVNKRSRPQEVASAESAPVTVQKPATRLPSITIAFSRTGFTAVSVGAHRTQAH